MSKILSPMQKEYVTKSEFGELKFEVKMFRSEFCGFRDEMRIFRSEMYTFRDGVYVFRTATNQRFDAIDKHLVGINERLNILTGRMDTLCEDMPRYVAIQREGFRDDLKVALEFLRPSQHLE